MDIKTRLLALREHARGHDIGFLLRGGDATFASALDDFIRDLIDAHQTGNRVDIPTFLLEYSDIIDQLHSCGIADSEIEAYSGRFGQFADITVVPVLALIFELNIGLSWAPGLVSSKCNDLEFDSDGLVVGPLSKIDFAGPRKLIRGKGDQEVAFNLYCCKTGIAYGDSYVIPFHYSIQQYNLGLSGGFLPFLSNFVAQHSTSVVGIKVSRDTLLDMSRFRESETRAYIRGPKGISPTKLRSESFPEDSRGDITEHLWVEDGSPESYLSESYFPTQGFQVMWSRNGSSKTCQAEEIVRIHNSRAKEGSVVYNRYVHAIWDTSKCCFTHFDGSIRGYTEKDYSNRVFSDIRNARDLSCSYTKLWRLDGEIPFENWADMFVKYFHGHNLAMEYMESAF